MNTNKVLLAISPGRHRLGYAVFTGSQLTYYGLFKLRQFQKKDELCHAVVKFLVKATGRFSIDGIAVRRLNRLQRTNELLEAINEQIQHYCLQYNISSTALAGRFVNEQFCDSNKRPTKDKVIKAILVTYPHLALNFHNGKSGRKQYYIQLFQAIAVGLVSLGRAHVVNFERADV